MAIAGEIKRAICSLFEVHQDEQDVQRVITPLEYPGSKDRIVVRVRPTDSGYTIDENGETALLITMNGGDVESETISRWAEALPGVIPVEFNKDEVICASVNDDSLIAPYIFRVAEAAQQLYAIANSRAERQENDFKEQVRRIVEEVAKSLELNYSSDVELPIAGGLRADHVLGIDKPLIIVAANSPTRLLEAEIIFMQYRAEKKPGYVLAIAENQEAVGKKQYERASYYTNKAVVFDHIALGKLIASEVEQGIH